jgi:hypothetical protein
MTEKSKMIRADEAQVLLLDKLLQQMTNLSKQVQENTVLVREQIPMGIVEPLNVEVTTENKVLSPPFDRKWFSISIVNDGPNNCFVIVNTELSNTNPHEVEVNGTFEVDIGAPKIKDLLLYCVAGTASLRIRGVR